MGLCDTTDALGKIERAQGGNARELKMKREEERKKSNKRKKG